MTILMLRTDKPEAEVGLYEDNREISHETWPAHRQLAETLHVRIRSLLERHSISLADIQGIVCYSGPGSFTGLRIGLTVASALAYSLQIPVVAQTGSQDSDPSNAWLPIALEKVLSGSDDRIAIPEYGADVHITQPKLVGHKD